MKNRIITGYAAAVLAVLVPLLLGGMGQDTNPAKLPAAEESVQAAASAQDAAERRVQAIVVHESETPSQDKSVTVQVTVEGVLQEMSLQDYLVGVLMGEMPASFAPEALKAQAVAARTYTLRRLEEGGTLSDDPETCQSFLPVEVAAEKWGEGWEANLAKLRQAVEETDGLVLTYDGALISATYFSCSGGKTESAQAVWGGAVPYLVSVDSPGEEDGNESTVTVTMEEFLTTLGIMKATVSAVTYTEGGGVETVTIGGETFAGTELRSLFGLRSTLFSMEITEDAVTFSVQGYGHRVGMSQYGAQAMAQEGKSFDEILKWYYTGVEVEAYGALS